MRNAHDRDVDDERSDDEGRSLPRGVREGARADDAGPIHRGSPIHEDPGAFGQAVGERLRLIRSQKGLSLQAVEADSHDEFKASVLGAYERGERAISVPRLARLAAFYKVPVDQLLPSPDPDHSDLTRDADGHGARIDLTQLEHMGGSESEMLHRYLHMIQVQRQDFNGRVLTIRRDDMRAIACILGVSYDAADRKLTELGLSMG